MRAYVRFALLLLLALAGARAGAHDGAAGNVTVAFESPDKFTDFGRLPVDIDDNVQAFRQMLIGVAQPHLHPGQTLQIDVLDIDLAGELAPGSSRRETRIVNPYDWTRMHFRYELHSPNAPVVAGDEQLDTRRQVWREGGEPFSNERRALERWFHTRFDHR